MRLQLTTFTASFEKSAIQRLDLSGSITLKTPMLRRIILALVPLFILAANPSLAAKSLVFADQKCVCEIPDDWVVSAKPGFPVVALSPDRTKVFDLHIVSIGSSAPWTGTQIANYEGGIISQGATIIDRRHLTLAHVPFYMVASTITTAKGPLSSHSFAGVANDRCYGLDFAELNGDPGTDSQFQAILNSFNFIGIPEVSTSSWENESTAYKTGFISARIAMVCLGLALLVFLCRRLYRLLKKRHQPEEEEEDLPLPPPSGPTIVPPRRPRL